LGICKEKNTVCTKIFTTSETVLSNYPLGFPLPTSKPGNEKGASENPVNIHAEPNTIDAPSKDYC
jgi:hypothetical protein